MPAPQDRASSWFRGGVYDTKHVCRQLPALLGDETSLGTMYKALVPQGGQQQAAEGAGEAWQHGRYVGVTGGGRGRLHARIEQGCQWGRYGMAHGRWWRGGGSSTQERPVAGHGPTSC